VEIRALRNFPAPPSSRSGPQGDSVHKDRRILSDIDMTGPGCIYTPDPSRSANGVKPSLQ